MTKALVLMLALSASTLTATAHAEGEQNQGPEFVVRTIDNQIPNSDLYRAEVVEVKTGQIISVLLSTKDVSFLPSKKHPPGYFVVRPELKLQEI